MHFIDNYLDDKRENMKTTCTCTQKMHDSIWVRQSTSKSKLQTEFMGKLRCHHWQEKILQIDTFYCLNVNADAF